MSQLFEKITTRLDEYFDTTKAILDDYVESDALKLEIETAQNNLYRDINAMDPGEEDFDTAIKILSELKTDAIDSAQLIEFCDDDTIQDKARQDGFFYVKTENIQQRELLEDFVTTHIWPHYNQQKDNILL